MSQSSDQADKRRGGGKSPNAYRTISEVAEEIDVPAHVLRFWESKFSQIKPMKRAGGRRYYRPDDVVLLRRIRDLLYDQGFTIKGVQKILRQGGAKAVLERDAEDTAAKAMTGVTAGKARPAVPGQRAELEAIVNDLREALGLLRRRAE